MNWILHRCLFSSCKVNRLPLTQDFHENRLSSAQLIQLLQRSNKTKNKQIKFFLHETNNKMGFIFSFEQHMWFTSQSSRKLYVVDIIKGEFHCFEASVFHAHWNKVNHLRETMMMMMATVCELQRALLQCRSKIPCTIYSIAKLLLLYLPWKQQHWALRTARLRSATARIG